MICYGSPKKPIQHETKIFHLTNGSGEEKQSLVNLPPCWEMTSSLQPSFHLLPPQHPQVCSWCSLFLSWFWLNQEIPPTLHPAPPVPTWHICSKAQHCNHAMCAVFMVYGFFPQRKKSFSDNKIIWKSVHRFCTSWFEIKVLSVNTFRFLSLAIMQKKTAHPWDGTQTTLWGMPDPRFYEKFLLRQWMDLLDSTSWWLHTNLYKRLLRIYSITKTLAFRRGLPKTHTYLAELRLSGHYPAG